MWDKAANANVGAWFYKDEKNAVIELTTGKLGDLSNVVITTPLLGNPLNGQVLTWDRSILAWTNKPIPQQIPPAPLATLTDPTNDKPSPQNVGDYYIAGVAGNYKNFTSPLNPTGVTAAKGDSIYWDGFKYILRVAPQSGASTLTDLTDTTITNPVKEDALVWDGTAWINKPATVIPKDPLATLLIPATDLPIGTQKPGDYYIAGVDGTYTNFGGVTATQGQRIYWDGTNYIVKDSYEVYLGNPTADGQVLSSLIDGTRSWVTNRSATALESIRENGVPGYRLISSNPNRHGDIGFQAIDFARPDGTVSDGGATGYTSFAGPGNTKAAGKSSVAFGDDVSAEGDYSFVSGKGIAGTTRLTAGDQGIYKGWCKNERC